jgi:UDP-N-acetylglucosamine acyltransferase
MRTLAMIVLWVIIVFLAIHVQLAGHVIIDDYAIFGGACAVHQFSKIGAHAVHFRRFVGAQRCAALYQSCTRASYVCRCKYRRFKKKRIYHRKINDIQEAYTEYIFLKGLNNTRALGLVERKNWQPSPERDYIVDLYPHQRTRSNERVCS